MKIINLTILFSFYLSSLFSQDKEKTECNCKETFLWLKKTFSENDAGYQDVINLKGVDFYNFHTSKIEKQVRKVKDFSTCTKLMNEWLIFFRKGHIGIYPNLDNQNNSNLIQNEISDDQIRLKFIDTKIIDFTEEQLKFQLLNKKNLDPIEGIWNFGNSYKKIGVIRDPNVDSIFNCFVIQADSVYWMPKQLKAIFTKVNDKYKCNYFLLDHSEIKTSATFYSNSESLLNIDIRGNENLCQKIFPISTTEIQDGIYFKLRYEEKPYLLNISSSTNYFRIPSFSYDSKLLIDSVLKTNELLINSTPNLIIDIRYGTGGADNSFEKLIPLMYTNPIRGIGNKLLATEINSKCYEKYAEMYKNGGDTASYNYCIEISKKLLENIGSYYERAIVDTIKLENITLQPKQIAIVCNKYNGSTDEEFLLTAKQSKKVKIFGVPTMGALDYSNINELISPDGKYKIWITISKSYRIPDFCIDGVGVQPDYYIDQTVPEEKWINFVQKILEN